MGRDEVRRRTFGLFGLLLSRTRAYTIIALFFAFTAFTRFLYSRDHRSFHPLLLAFFPNLPSPTNLCR